MLASVVCFCGFLWKLDFDCEWSSRAIIYSQIDIKCTLWMKRWNHQSWLSQRPEILASMQQYPFTWFLPSTHRPVTNQSSSSHISACSVHELKKVWIYMYCVSKFVIQTNEPYSPSSESSQLLAVDDSPVDCNIFAFKITIHNNNCISGFRIWCT